MLVLSADARRAGAARARRGAARSAARTALRPPGPSGLGRWSARTRRHPTRQSAPARLDRLMAPEHGLWGAPQDHVPIHAEKDPVSGLPAFSLYGTRRVPTPAMLRDLDALVVDLQDVGSRYYTFVWTTALAMQACARARVPVVILDRPNPLGGELTEGNVADPAFASFVGLYPLAVRHGMTIGELAQYLNAEHSIGCDLTVVPMRGWRRSMLWEATGLPWVPPSPNMPTPDTARVYPGGCLIEGTNLSEGRGTTRPFEWVGRRTSTRTRTPRRSRPSACPASAFVQRGSGRHFRSGRGNLWRRPASRHRRGAIQAVPDRRRADRRRAGRGPSSLRLAPPTLRVRAAPLADRHPVRHGSNSSGHRAAPTPARAGRRVAPPARRLDAQPPPLPALHVTSPRDRRS